MFLLKNQIGDDIRNARKELKLTKEKLAGLSNINVKTLRHLEEGERIGEIKTFLKINDALKRNFNLDLSEKIGIKVVWKFGDLDQKGINIIEGSLLGDGCIAKYETSRQGIYLQEAKDKRYLEWLGGLLNESGIKCKIVPTKSKSSYSKSKKPFYRLYTHSCPALFDFRKKWYISNIEGKETKRVPADLKLTPITLLHWYLGDGNFKRDNRKFPKGGRPTLRICTNDFLKEDIKLLLKKLREDLDLNFYPLPKLNKNIKRGYILHLYPNDLFKFFKIIGQKPLTEIESSITKKVEGGKTSTFKEKWPNEENWVKILAKTKGIGQLLKEKRKELGLTQRELAKRAGVKKHHISEVECGRKQMSLKCFIKILDILKLDIKGILITLSNKKAGELVSQKLKEDLTAADLIEAIAEVIK